jgi:Predicted membrane protein
VKTAAHRLWPIDCVRGLAVVCMVFYHFMWDMTFFGLYPHDVTAGGWRVFARTVATTFVLLVGVSMALTAQRKPQAERDRQWLERGAKVLAWGLVISAVTRVVLGEAFILYGILHLVGTALLLGPLLWRVRRFALPLGVAFVAAGPYLDARAGQLDALVPWAIPLGVRPAGYAAVDYFPLVPWLGVILLGMAVGQWARPLWARLSAGRPAPRLLEPIAVLGRHSLLIYIIHQPLILGGFLLFGYTMW